MSVVIHARQFATKKHLGQTRKYTGEPYIVHPNSVAEMVDIRGGTEEMVAAALLHDVLEDTDTTVEELNAEFGGPITNLVVQLTDIFTKKAYPLWNRAKRKEMEARRLGTVSPEAKEIKLCDAIDNTLSIMSHDPGGFGPVFLREKAFLLEQMFKK